MAELPRHICNTPSAKAAGDDPKTAKAEHNETTVNYHCYYCRAPQPWTGPCSNSANGGHWTAAERIGALEQENAELVATLRHAHGLILAGARALRAIEVRGRRARRKALRDLPSRPDSLDLATEAAKISDTFAVMYGDPSLPVGAPFDQLEGRK